jgi:predicted nucleic acid-binding protein
VIVLDTNVLSEALNPLPSEMVLRWMARLEPDAVFVTAIAQAEILYGIQVMAGDKRRTALSTAVEKVFRRIGGTCSGLR